MYKGPPLRDKFRIQAWYVLGDALSRIASASPRGILWAALYRPYNFAIGRSADLDEYGWTWKSSNVDKDMYVSREELGYGARCNRCGAGFEVRVGIGLVAMPLHCERCGREWWWNFGPGGPSGKKMAPPRCDCGGTFASDAPPRCPACRSTDFRQDAWAPHVPFDMTVEEVANPAWPELSLVWRETSPECLPVAEELKRAYEDRWVRFHSLPESKRYPDDESEYEIVLHRCNTILDEMFAGQKVYVVTATRDNHLLYDNAECHRLNPASRPWTVLREVDLGSGGKKWGTNYRRLHASEHQWRTGLLDPLLRAIADDLCAFVLIFAPESKRIHHPYDGGADCILEETAARDRIKAAYADWLSIDSSGL